jgi:hypothetical protein
VPLGPASPGGGVPRTPPCFTSNPVCLLMGICVGPIQTCVHENRTEIQLVEVGSHTTFSPAAGHLGSQGEMGVWVLSVSWGCPLMKCVVMIGLLDAT